MRDGVGDEEEGEREPHASLNAHRMPANMALTSDARTRNTRFEPVYLCERLRKTAKLRTGARDFPGASRAAGGNPA